METTILDSNVILYQLANTLKLDIEADCDELLLNLPQEHGQGVIRGTQLSNGVNVIAFQCSFNRPVRIVQNSNYTYSPMRFIYVKTGSVKYTYNESNIHCELKEEESAITAGNKNSGDFMAFNRNENLEVLVIEINRDEFVESNDCNLNSIDHSFAKIFRDTEGTVVFHWTSHYSIGISECLDAIFNCKRDHSVKRFFLEGKVFEIFSHQLKMFGDDLKPKDQEMVLRQTDVDLIREAKRILSESLDEAPTIIELSRMVGINQQKLKKGFKQIYHTTPYRFLRNARLNESRLLLLEGSTSVSEVAEKIGYSNKSHFAKRFKEKFGVLPREFVKEFKANI